MFAIYMNPTLILSEYSQKTRLNIKSENTDNILLLILEQPKR